MLQLKNSPIMVYIEPEILPAETARKRANVWLLYNVGNLLRAEQPKLMLTNQRQLYWGVDVMLTSPSVGNLGRVGQLEIDATTGEILNNLNVAQEIMTNVQSLVKN